MKTSTKYIIIFIIFIFDKFSAQQIDTTLFSRIDTINNIYIFKNNLNLGKEDIRARLNSIFGLNSDYSFQVSKENVDFKGLTHIRYKQFFQNILIENSTLLLHTDSTGKLWFMNGEVIKLNGINCANPISINQATDAAVMATQGMDYLWLNDSLDLAAYREFMGDSTVSIYPTAELMITDIASDKDSSVGNYFVYKVLIKSNNPSMNKLCYIDAINGNSIISPRSTIRTCFANQTKVSGKNNSGSLYNKGNRRSNFQSNLLFGCAQPCVTNAADLLYYGPQNIITDRYKKNPFSLNCNYRLKNSCANGTYLYVKQWLGQNYHDFDNLNTNWGTDDHEGTTALWTIERSHLYFDSHFQRHSFDNNYSQIEVLVNPNDNSPTGWDDQTNLITANCKLCTGNCITTNWQVSLDILGHELTHGVQKYSANGGFNQNDLESSALAEGLADCFGTMVEFNAASLYNLNGKTPNYDVGEDIFTQIGARRSLSNPPGYNCPDTYNGPFWPNDLDPHRLGGVVGKWFYLLAEGGSSTNGVGNQYCVKGVGKDIASLITYNTMVYYLPKTCSYAQFGQYALLAANGLYGLTFPTSEVAACNYAVNISNQTPLQAIPVIYIYGVSNVNQNINLNNSLYVKPYTVNSGVTVNMSSSIQIDFASSSPPAVPSVQEVKILSGSEFHAYIAPSNCANGSRQGNSDNSPNVGNGIGTMGTSSLSSNNNSENKPMPYGFSVIPNPNNGQFKLALNEGVELPNNISIISLLGEEVLSVKSPNSYYYDFILGNVSNGMYVIKVSYLDRTIMKRFVKD